MSASNDFSEYDVELFLSKIKEVTPFPKLREVAKILKPYFTLDKINAILKYLERSNQIIIDLDGNIVWIKENNLKSNLVYKNQESFQRTF